MTALSQLACAPVRAEIPSLIRPLVAVVAAILDEHGNVIDCNEGFSFLLNRPGDVPASWNVRQFFVQPGFASFTSTLSTDKDAPVYSGILNIGDPTVGCRSITGTVYRVDDHLVLIGEFDIADLEQLSATVVELNNDLAQAQRELVKANRELKRNEKKITEMMLTDPMTGIANRRHFDQRINEELNRHLRYSIPLSFVMCDIDHFKSVNDTYGHDIGDIVICAFAHTLRDNKRDSDFVARIGGEEFILLLPETQSDDAYRVVDRMRELFGSMKHHSVERSITASFGVTMLMKEDTPDCLIKRADQCLYEAKESGRNRVIVFNG